MWKIIFKTSGEYKYIFIEASSHSLVQDRFFSFRLDAAAWTNFSQDHLDYHENMENYFQAKLKLFTQLDTNSTAIVNIDDE